MKLSRVRPAVQHDGRILLIAYAAIFRLSAPDRAISRLRRDGARQPRGLLHLSGAMPLRAAGAELERRHGLARCATIIVHAGMRLPRAGIRPRRARGPAERSASIGRSSFTFNYEIVNVPATTAALADGRLSTATYDYTTTGAVIPIPRRDTRGCSKRAGVRRRMAGTVPTNGLI